MSSDVFLFVLSPLVANLCVGSEVNIELPAFRVDCKMKQC